MHQCVHQMAFKNVYELKKQLAKSGLVWSRYYYLRQGGYVFVGLCLSVCLSVCEQDNSRSYGRIFLKFWGNVGRGLSYK